MVDTITPKILHLISCIVFISLAVITLRAFLLGESVYQYRDDIWSNDLGHMISNALNTFNIEASRRIIYLGPIFRSI